MTDETTLYSEFKVIVPQGTSIRDMAVALQGTCLNHTIKGITKYDPDEAHRPAFEEWIKKHITNPDLQRHDGEYILLYVRSYWMCWLASRREFE